MKVNFNLARKDKTLTKKLKLECIDLTIYKCKILIASREQTKIINKAWKINSNQVAADTSDYTEETREILITINILEDKYMVHELYHAVDIIFRYIGETYSPVSESKAYLMEYLFEEYLKIKKKL